MLEKPQSAFGYPLSVLNTEAFVSGFGGRSVEYHLPVKGGHQEMQKPSTERFGRHVGGLRFQKIGQSGLHPGLPALNTANPIRNEGQHAIEFFERHVESDFVGFFSELRKTARQVKPDGFSPEASGSAARRTERDGGLCGCRKRRFDSVFGSNQPNSTRLRTVSAGCKNPLTAEKLSMRAAIVGQ